jgi:hypothetical protein
MQVRYVTYLTIQLHITQLTLVDEVNTDDLLCLDLPVLAQGDECGVRRHQRQQLAQRVWGQFNQMDPADMGDKIEGGTQQGVSLFIAGASAHDCL